MSVLVRFMFGLFTFMWRYNLLFYAGLLEIYDAYNAIISILFDIILILILVVIDPFLYKELTPHLPRHITSI